MHLAHAGKHNHCAMNVINLKGGRGSIGPLNPPLRTPLIMYFHN